LTGEGYKQFGVEEVGEVERAQCRIEERERDLSSEGGIEMKAQEKEP
jgi:hypothetical protein